jgi:carboxymethylenebutenolidase
MTERTETVTTAEGKMDVFVTHPESGAGPWPVLVQLMDGIGMREELREHARRAASWGYYVLAPDLFYRFDFESPLDLSQPAQLENLMKAIGELTAERATADIEAALAIAAADPLAKRGPIGLYGFCMGGKLTLQLSQSLGDRVAAGASIHPGGLSTPAPDSPHRHLDRVSAEIYFGIADKDAMATPEQMADLEAELKAHDVTYQLEWHPGALHGYMMPSRPELYHREAAEKVWGRMEALFARTVA